MSNNTSLQTNWPSNTSLGYYIKYILKGDIKDYVEKNRVINQNYYLRWWGSLNTKQRFYFKEMDRRNETLLSRYQKPKSFYSWKRTNQL